KPCDQAGEDCPLGAAKASGHKERVLHIHQTPRGREHVDVEMLPIHDRDGVLIYFVELLHPVPLASGVDSAMEMVGESKVFQKMVSKIARVGRREASVLLLGESGTGKELAARAIHMASARKDKALVSLECAGLTDALFESELFGHVKGAFTGAINTKKGLVELANGGTLFLDEIGDIPLPMQVKLLRLIETGTFRPLGSSEVRTSDFRLICATHKNLYEMVRTGEFRTDLYYRINVFPILLPSLAERSADIPLIAKSLLSRIDPAGEYRFTSKATRKLQTLEYPGNIRELRNLISRALVMADTNVVDDQVIALALEDAPDRINLSATERFDSSDTQWVDLKTHEKRYLSELMEAHQNDKEVVARILGISTRSLYRKLQD
ncbi:MAG: sigma 54-interacting transcriptional regulator, partial [Rhizobiaceae bacterium]|nr:sigma 54-interacting transcriptional regulator [Rhizobiaceae bacterium]